MIPSFLMPKSVYHRAIFITFCALALIGVSLYTYHLSYQSGWFNLSDPNVRRNGIRFDQKQTIGLIAFLIISPCTYAMFLFSYSSWVVLAKSSSWSRFWTQILHLCAFHSLLFAGIYGLRLAVQVLKCGVFFCIDTPWSTWSTLTLESEFAHGWRDALGLWIAFFSFACALVPLTAMFKSLFSPYCSKKRSDAWSDDKNLLLRFETPWNILYSPQLGQTKYGKDININNNGPMSIQEGSVNASPSSSRGYGSFTGQITGSSSSSDPLPVFRPPSRHCCRISTISVFVVIIIALFISSYMPNNWESFSPGRIARRAAYPLVYNDEAKCRLKRNNMCPDLPDTPFFLRTFQIPLFYKDDLPPDHLNNNNNNTGGDINTEYIDEYSFDRDIMWDLQPSMIGKMCPPGTSASYGTDICHKTESQHNTDSITSTDDPEPEPEPIKKTTQFSFTFFPTVVHFYLLISILVVGGAIGHWTASAYGLFRKSNDDDNTTTETASNKKGPFPAGTPSAYKSPHGTSFNAFFSRKVRVWRLSEFISCTRCLDWTRDKLNPHHDNNENKPLCGYTYFSYGEVFAICLTLLFSYAAFHYWFFNHNWHTYWPSWTPTMWERITRSTGVWASIIFALLFFPAARNSPVLALCHISWDRAILYHKWLGLSFMLLALAHGIGAVFWYHQEGQLADLFHFPQRDFGFRSDFTISHALVITIVAVIICAISISWVRRRNYSLFMVLHYILYLTMIPAILLHATLSFQYFLPALAIWLTDRLVRVYRGFTCVELVPIIRPDDKHHNVLSSRRPRSNSGLSEHLLAEEHNEYSSSSDNNTDGTPRVGVIAHDCGSAGRFIELILPYSALGSSATCPLPGQYSFINIAEVSLFEWHPFSMLSCIHAHIPQHLQTFRYLIKCTGSGSGSANKDDPAGDRTSKAWTESLYSLIMENYAETSSSSSSTLHNKKTMSTPIPSSQLDNSPISSSSFVPFSTLSLSISIDGPYGDPLDLSTCPNVLIIGGGVGLSPCFSVYESLLYSYRADYLSLESNHTDCSILRPQLHNQATRRFKMIGIARDASLYHTLVSPVLSQNVLPEPVFELDLYATSQSTPKQIAVLSTASSSDEKKNNSTIDQSSSEIEINTTMDNDVEIDSNCNNQLPRYLGINNYITYKRPQLQVILDQWYMNLLHKQGSKRSGNGNYLLSDISDQSMIFVCGPNSLISSIQDWAYDKRIPCFSDLFEM